MTSHFPSFDNHEEDDFDWDAAVREIDAVCQSTSTSAATTTTTTNTSYLYVTPPPQPPPPEAALNGQIINGWNNNNNNQLNKPTNNSRQLTLDKFMTSTSNCVSRSNGIGGIDEKGDEIRVSDSDCLVEINPHTANTWIYPDNVPRREYQLAISKTALFSNTLVALPTGLGKTLIAAVVMYNYFRWFPEGKIVFAAPSRPLVMQQIEACHNIVGIPQEWTIDMTGQTSPPKRAALWRSKRVFFVTPQVLEKDIQSGACLVKLLVCLVIDEAHRAMGNYAYCVAVRELMAVPVHLRILALTATPGSKQQTIQQVIDNLLISTLEYRSEDDVDVCPYVHNRKIELYEVPMGKDANEINNLLMEAIRPLATRLCTMRVLQNRDFQTFSPCDLLSARDKFRQAPPPELSSVKHSEVEGYFGVLITLYHIRKLLSSHGIRPSHEMLEEKLRQGYFARLMSRNEAIQKADVLMQKSLSHGAPSPKLSKMLEVLVDHFRNNDPKNSRVIIFSNFRGSVRDIMDSLATIGNLVKPTQFIGQSSGKTLKGQTQKIQQAVLEKFRMGGYNVIVATSIGEEGLDIMEVDLVICFDANISPLRMIQRMGRTGRKHDGRVVVLACEGTELKGYKRKLATGKSVKKHMENGGFNSFNFHCSPRMVPHLYKPELQFVELSIEKFVRQTKKGKDDLPQSSKYRAKLTDAEAALLAHYFQPSKEPCNLSLIAFPHFQAFPSGVHRVKHSARAGWLIDAMQHLQGLSSSPRSNPFNFDFSRSRCLTAGGLDQQNESRTELFDPCYHTGSQTDISTSKVHNPATSLNKEHQMLDFTNTESRSVVRNPAISPQKEQNMPDTFNQTARKGHSVETLQFPIDEELTETATDEAVIFQTPPYDDICPKETVFPVAIDLMESESPLIPARKLDLDISDLSPRLTSFIESGFVPESPLAEYDTYTKEDPDDTDCNIDALKNEIIDMHESPARCRVSPFRPAAQEDVFAASTQARESPARCHVSPFTPAAQEDVFVASTPARKITPPLVVDNVRPCLNGEAEGPSMRVNAESESVQNLRTPLQNLTNSSCEDWRMSSGEKSGSGRHTRLKRLRKLRDLSQSRPQQNAKKFSSSFAACASKVVPPMVIKHGRVKKQFGDARDFIDEEAEVSSEDVIPDSEDEANCENSNAYEDSFIDDQIEPTVGTLGSSQAVDSKMDMMAIYRRSLLTQITQSPFQEQQKDSTVESPKSVPSITTIAESGESSVKTCAQTPHSRPKYNFSRRNSVGSRFRQIIPSNNSCLINLATTESRKRKSYSNKPFILPAKNLEKEFRSHAELSSKVNKPLNIANGADTSCPSFSDDQFYEGLDLDELEAQAAKIISQKRGPSTQSIGVSVPSADNAALLDAPSFDLGFS